MANPMVGLNTFRTPLAPLARDFYAHGFQHPGPWIREVENRSNSDELFEHGKPEAYALAAVLSGELMRRMTMQRSKFPPFGVDTEAIQDRLRKAPELARYRKDLENRSN